MRADHLLALAAGLGAAVACATGCAPEPAPLRVTAVEPARGSAVSPTPVRVRGEGFLLAARLGTSGSAGDAVDGGFRAWLGGAPLGDVAWVDARTLTAVVPAGLPEGVHALEVEGPTGRRGRLDAAFEVRAPRAVLAAALAIPAVIPAGDFLATLTVENRGDGGARAVRAQPPGPASANAADVALEGGGGSAVDLAAGARATFTWVLRAAPGAGPAVLEAGARGLDAASGAEVVAPPAISNPGTVTPREVERLLVDPFADGASAAQLVTLGDGVLLGPRADGAGLLRLDPLDGPPAALALAFPADDVLGAGGSRTSNTAPPPYPSIGSPGCAPDTLACGPDGEAGRGLWTSGILGGTEWLLASGLPPSGGVTHVYLSDAAGDPLAFRYVDLAAVMPGPRGVLSAAVFAEGRAYLGFGGALPGLIALLGAPPAPGLDATAADAIDLDVARLPGAGGPGAPRVDALAHALGTLHVATARGLSRATRASPGPHGSAPGDWADATPDDPAWAAQTPGGSDAAAGILPADRAVPGLAVWRGRLLALRNTAGGPQLWACTPGAGGDPGACDPADWTLLAPSPADPTITRLGASPVAAGALLAVTPGALWVGFDAPGGLEIWRSGAALPSADDFRGRGGCAAGAAGCEGLGAAGLGRGASLPRILDARAIEQGGAPALLLLAGDGAAPARLYRFRE
jgi:hypothetical protein